MAGSQLKSLTLDMPKLSSRSHANRPGAPASSSSFILSSLLVTARSLLIGILVYAAWRFGCVETNALQHVAAALGLVVGLASFAFLFFRWRPLFPSIIVIALPLLFIGYSILQITPLPASWLLSTEQANEVRTQYGEQPAEAVLAVAKEFGQDTAQTPKSMVSSIIPQHTKLALIPLLLATTYCFLASLLFDTSKSRMVFLWCIVLNTTALSLWGIIQRSTGSTEILPGVANTAGGIPFSSFVYRNAGAAAILPGLAAVIAIYRIGRKQPNFASFTSSAITAHSSRTYGNPNRIFTVKELVLVSTGCVIVVAVLAALSRGAWIAGSVAIIVAALALRREFRFGKSFVILSFLVAIASITNSQVTHQIEARMQRVSIQELTLNERWSHWQVGFETAKNYFPFGSGLGTYGYATLLHQSSPTAVWFREAHNEYLEVFTESGIIGVLLLLTAIAWSLFRCCRIFFLNANAVDASFGLFALLVMVCALVQNTVDFVATLPANLFLLAGIFGILGSLTPMVSGHRNSYGSKRSFNTTPALAAILFCSFPIVVYCIRYCEREQIGDEALKLASIAELNDAVEGELLAERIAILDQAIESQADRADLFRHRAVYRLAQYRAAIIEAGEQAGETITWQNTQPEMIYAILASLPASSRISTIQSLTTSEVMRGFLGHALKDIANGICCNPLFGQLHLTCAALSPIAGWPADDWIKRSASLSKSDPDKLYTCGLLAYYNNQNEQMQQDWTNCLMVSRAYDKTIFELSMQRLSPTDIVLNMIPPTKPESTVTLVRTILNPTIETASTDAESRRKAVSEVARALINQPTTKVDRQHAVAASIFELIDEHPAATEQWLLAVAADPKNSLYRLKAAEELRTIGKFTEALNQVALGSTLSPIDERFGRLANRIRSELAKANQ